MKQLRYKYYSKQFTTPGNDNLQSQDQEKSTLNSTINASSDAHTLTDDKIIKSPFNKNNAATIKNKKNFNNDFTTRVCRIPNIVQILCSYSKMVNLLL